MRDSESIVDSSSRPEYEFRAHAQKFDSPDEMSCHKSNKTALDGHAVGCRLRIGPVFFHSKQRRTK